MTPPSFQKKSLFWKLFDLVGVMRDILPECNLAPYDVKGYDRSNLTCSLEGKNFRNAREIIK